MFLFIFLLNVVAIFVDGVNFDVQRRYHSFSDENVDKPKGKLQVAIDNSSFYYFAYGTNLLQSKLKRICPSAKMISVASLQSNNLKAKCAACHKWSHRAGFLQGWRLDFNSYNDRWKGAEATIVEDPKSCVWGALYLIYNSERWNLDNEAGVSIDAYYEKNVKVTQRRKSKKDNEVSARTHVQYNPPGYVAPHELPKQRQPSQSYSQIMFYGALRAGLPAKYLQFIQQFPNNREELKEMVMEAIVGYPYFDDIKICD